jgi:VWFA-related protein
MTRFLPYFGLAMLLGLPASAPAQNQRQAPAAPGQQQPPPPPPAIISRTPIVIVPVTVKDSHGQLVGDLTRDDFRILEVGVEQKIAGFSSEAVPLSAVVLLDNDLDQRVVKDVQKSLISIAAGFGPDDEVAMVSYEEFPETISDFSKNNDALFTMLKRFEIGSHNHTQIVDPAFPAGGPPPSSQAPPGGAGPTNVPPLTIAPKYKTDVDLTDAIFAAGEMLKGRGRDRRKIIFLISDEANANNNAHSFDETLRSLLISDISLYSISVSRSVPVGKKFLQKGAADLQKYATDTGGDTFYSRKEGDLDRLYPEITEQARNEYTLTFSPQEVGKGQDYHPIEVRVKRPDLSIQTREGFYESAIMSGR